MPKLPDPEQAVLLGGPGAADALAEKAPVFAPLVDRFGPARVSLGGDPFAALVHAIANQQLSIQAGATVYGRLVDKLGGEVAPAALAELDAEEIRACGFSRPKVTYLQDLARRTLEGTLRLDQLEDLQDDDVVHLLTEVKGIGEWTAHMVLIFDLHRPDVLAKGDLGVQDGARLLLELDERPAPGKLMELADPWRPYRSLACWYLWMERDRLVR